MTAFMLSMFSCIFMHTSLGEHVLASHYAQLLSVNEQGLEYELAPSSICFRNVQGCERMSLH